MQVHSYNDSEDILRNPGAFDEAYMRGAVLNSPDGSPRDCRKFFLREGIQDGFATLRLHVDRVKTIGKRVGFRLIDAGHVPDGYASITVGSWKYVDLRDANTRTKYELTLRAFAAQFPDLDWIDIPYPFCPSNEPGVAHATIDALGNGNVENGKAAYLGAATWLIELYAEVFPRKCIGNLGGPSWAAMMLLPYAIDNGVNGFRQDSFGRFDWQGTGRVEGENRATMYDERIAWLGGRGAFDRLIFEVTGNGVQTHSNYPTGEMFAYPGGEYYELEATDCGNMGLPIVLTETQEAKSRLADFYEYAGGSEPVPDPDPDPDPDPVPPPESEFVVSREMYARIFFDNVHIHNGTPDAVGLTLHNGPETAAFLRAVADAMDGK